MRWAGLGAWSVEVLMNYEMCIDSSQYNYQLMDH